MLRHHLSFPAERAGLVNAKQFGEGYSDIGCRMHGLKGTIGTHYGGAVRRTQVAGYFDMKHQAFFGLPALPDPRGCGGGGVIGDYPVLAGGFWGVGETGFRVVMEVSP